MAKIILFIHPNSGESGKHFLKTIQGQFSGTTVDVCRTTAQLDHKLKEPRKELYENKIIILFADNQKRLKNLSNMVDLFDGECLIIILPDHTEAVRHMGHKFYPRYFSYKDGTYEDVNNVLIKMLNRKILPHSDPDDGDNCKWN